MRDRAPKCLAPAAVTLSLALALAFAAPSRAAGPTWAPRAGVRLETVASGLDNPVGLASPPGDPRLFVIEQSGRIRIIEGGRVLPAPFLDVSREISSGGERGLLGLAFHPGYARNGLFFVDYTDRNGDTRIVRYTASADRSRADAASARPVLWIKQPYANHNGGGLAFGPDGRLYIGTGDGGSGGDPHDNGQSLGTLLGKMLRIDVDRGVPYAIPADNPFRRRPGERPEIWALGLRNPWRFSFDRETGELWIGDVGQNRWEEIDVAPAGAAGLNYGWNRMEGSHAYAVRDSLPRGLTAPIVEYPHDQGCSVTGGFVYRGRAIPALRGAYVFSDYCRGWIRSFRRVAGRPADFTEWDVGRTGSVTSFGEDAAGELYVLTMDGRVSKLVPDAPAAPVRR